MNRFAIILLVALATIGSWLFFREFPVENLPGMSDQPLSLSSPPAAVEQIPLAPLFPRDPRYVRIATFNIQLRHRTKGDNPDILRQLATILAQFDVVAIQEVLPDQHHVLGSILDVINASGKNYDYVIGPRVGRTSQEQLAYVFDRERVEIDRHELYTIEDPDDLLNFEPFVAWFRCRGHREEDAFTFSLVNVHTDSLERERENSVLAGVFREVRNDRRGEDDVILLGDFDESAERMTSLSKIPDPIWAVTDMATDTRAEGQYSNIVCSRQSTDEATGRSGVFDFLREMNLSLDQAIQISEQLPVWAEFSLVEGGQNNLARMQDDPAVQ